MTVEDWYSFKCCSCGWETIGCYNFERQTANATLPDTDCPKCGSHDGVLGGESVVPRPSAAEAATARGDQNTGRYATRGYGPAGNLTLAQADALETAKGPKP